MAVVSKVQAGGVDPPPAQAPTDPIVSRTGVVHQLAEEASAAAEEATLITTE